MDTTNNISHRGCNSDHRSCVAHIVMALKVHMEVVTVHLEPLKAPIALEIDHAEALTSLAAAVTYHEHHFEPARHADTKWCSRFVVNDYKQASLQH